VEQKKLSLSSGLANFRAAMKRFLFALFCAVSVCSAAEKTPVELFSLSVQIFPATTQDGIGFSWDLAYSSVGSETSINHELMLASGNHGFSHEGYFVFENDFEFEPFLVPFVLDVPPNADVNGNGIDDFFDRRVSVDGVETLGRHPDANNRPVDFTATWTRPAGESVGSVVVDLPYLGITFTHPFQLLDYSGEFTYERTNSLLRGTMTVTNVVDTTDIITGPLSVRVVNPTTLSLSAATWTNSYPATFTVLTNLYDGVYGTNFVSYWLLDEGYAPSGDLDYVDWLLVLSSADANNNGQLDLVEGNSTPAAPPRLDLVRLPNGSIEITIRGSPGQTYTLEFANAVDSAAWQASQTINLVSETQTITVTASGSRRFFRLRQ
jgi:hypothetical protein